MAAGIWKLRLTQLLNFQLSSPSRLLGRVLLALCCIGIAVGVAVVPHFLGASTRQLSAIDTIVWSVVTVIAACFAFLNSESFVDPRQFASFPRKYSSTSLSLLFSTVLSWPALILLLWFAVTVTLRVINGASAWSAVLSGVIGFLAVIVGVRLFSVLGTLTFTPRNRSFLKSSGIVILVAMLPLTAGLLMQSLQPEAGVASADAAFVLGWAPFGAAASAVSDVTSGNITSAAMRYLVSIGGLCAAVICWMLLAKHALTSVAVPETPGYARRGLGWFERFPARPWGVIGARSVIYWIRDPRYRMGLLAVPIAPLLVVAVLSVAGVDERVMVMVPLPIMLLLLGWSVHNDVAADSTAVWSHIASGTKGRDDRIGRIIPVMMIGIPLVVIGSSLSATILADWRILPALVGLNLSVLCVSAGVSSVASALLPYPFTRPGESPFTQPSGTGLGVGGTIAQCVSMISALVLCLPVAWLAANAVTEVTFTANIFALIGCLLYGLVILMIGITIGGKIFAQSAPELLTISQSFD